MTMNETMVAVLAASLAVVGGGGSAHAAGGSTGPGQTPDGPAPRPRVL